MAIQDAFDAIRFYTVLDPYYYTIDNRPLQDFETNQTLLADAGDAGYDASKAVAIAAGFSMRGYAQENFGVGQVSFPVDLTFQVDRAIFNHALAVSGTDAREVPHLGIGIDPVVIGPFTAAVTPGEERPFLVQARKVDADANTPFYDPANVYSDEAYIIGGIEYDIKQGADVAIGAGIFSIPAPDAGWIPAFNVILIEGSATVDPADVTYGTAAARFHDEGAVLGGGGGGSSFELNVDTRIATADQQTFTLLSVDANFALVFLDGVFQSGATVIDADTVDLAEPVPAGSVVDFVTTAGGTYIAGTVKRDRRIATLDQQVFGSLTVNAFFASIYIQGVYQDEFNVIDSQTIELISPVPEGTRVVFEEKSAGIADVGIVVPPGGDPGFVLTKNSGADYDFDWLPGGGGAVVPNGGSTGQVLTKNSNADQDVDWLDSAGGGGPGLPFSVETQLAAAGQVVFVVATDPSTMMVYRQGIHITEDVIITPPNQISVAPAAAAGEEFVFVQTGGGTLDAITIQKENDLQLILNSRNSTIPPDAAINDVEPLPGNVLLAGSVASAELWRSNNAGQTWQPEAPGNLPAGIYGLAYNGSRLIAVGDGGDNSYSDDLGVSWTSNAAVPGVAVALTSAAWDADNSLFITVGDGGVLATSVDGITWIPQVLDGGTIDFKDVHDASGRTVAVGKGGTVENIFTSTDGLVWFAATEAGLTGGFEKVYNGGGVWFASGENEIATSISGASWGNAAAITEEGTGILYVDGVYLVFAEMGNVWASTDSAVTWTNHLLGGNVLTDYIKAATVVGSSISLLGSYQMTRYISKIIRGI